MLVHRSRTLGEDASACGWLDKLFRWHSRGFREPIADIFQKPDDLLDICRGRAPVDEAKPQRGSSVESCRRDKRSAGAEQLCGDRLLQGIDPLVVGPARQIAEAQ